MTENTIDDLMNLDPLELTASNIDAIIAYHRKNRANSVDGAKPKKEVGPKISLDALVAKMAPKSAAQVVKRRI